MTAKTPPRQTQAEEEDALAVAEADDDSIVELCDSDGYAVEHASGGGTGGDGGAAGGAGAGGWEGAAPQARTRSSKGQGCAPKSFWRRSKAELAALKAAAEKAEAANKERERKRIAFNAAVNEMKAKPENMQGEFEETPNFTARQAALVAELKLRFCMGDDAPAVPSAAVCI